MHKQRELEVTKLLTLVHMHKCNKRAVTNPSSYAYKQQLGSITKAGLNILEQQTGVTNVSWNVLIQQKGNSQ